MVGLQEIVQLGQNVQSVILAWGPSLSTAHSTSVPRVVDYLVLEGSFVCCETVRVVRKGNQEETLTAKPQGRQFTMVYGDRVMSKGRSDLVKSS